MPLAKNDCTRVTLTIQVASEHILREKLKTYKDLYSDFGRERKVIWFISKLAFVFGLTSNSTV